MNHSSLFQTFFKYVSQNILGMIGLSCYILADTFYIAKGMGANGLTALNLAIPVYSFIHGTGLMIGIGGATNYTLLTSQGEKEQGNRMFTHAFFSALFCGIFFLLLGLTASAPLTRLLGADKITFSMTNTYLKTLMCFSPLFVLNNTMLAFVRNDGSPKLSMLGMLLGSFANILFDYLFIFPCELGIFGAALATGFSPLVSLCILSRHFLGKHHQFHLIRCSFSSKSLGKILSLGLSSLITELSSGIVLIAFNLILLRLSGNTGVAAYGVIANLALVAMAIYTGISQGMQPVISHTFGLGKKQDTKKVLFYALLTSVFFSSCMYLLVALFATQLTALFNSEGNPALSRLAIPGLRIYFAGFFFYGINVICAAFFSSVDLPGKGFLISILRGFLLILPVVFLLSSVFHITGVWLAFTITEALTLFVTLFCWFRFQKSFFF